MKRNFKTKVALFTSFSKNNLNLRKKMEKPYLPVLFDEIKEIKAEDFLSWPSQRIR